MWGEYNFSNMKQHILYFGGLPQRHFVPSFQAHERENIAMSHQQLMQPLPPIQQQPQHHGGAAASQPQNSSKYPEFTLGLLLVP